MDSLVRQRVINLTTLAVLLAAAPVRAQTGLLVVAHGAGPEWNEAVRQTVRTTPWSAGPIDVAFLMGSEATSATWDAAVTRLVRGGARDVVAVPLMVSSFGAHYEQVEHYAGLRHELPPALAAHAHAPAGPAPVPVRVTRALDSAPELFTALAARWADLDGADRLRPLLLVAHGPESDDDAARWLAGLAGAEPSLRRAGFRAELRIALLRDDAAAAVRATMVAAMRDTVRALAARAGDSVVALPLLIASSTLSRQRIPADLADLPLRYVATALTPHPAISDWIARVAREALPQPGRPD